MVFVDRRQPGRCGALNTLAAQPDSPTTAPSAVTSLFAMGDWGEDTSAERQVAGAMMKEARADASPPAFALLLGDNFYFKLTGVDDPHWQTLFELMYDPAVLGVPFYACLGNHDYDGNNLQIEMSYARQHPESRFKLPAEWYRVDLPKTKPAVTVFMLDSNRDNLSELQWNEQTQWLDKQLAGPRTVDHLLRPSPPVQQRLLLGQWRPAKGLGHAIAEISCRLLPLWPRA